MLRMQSGIVFEWDEVGKNVLSQTQKKKPWKTPWHFVFLWTLSRSPVDAAHDNDEIVQGNAAVTSSSCWLLSFFLLFSTRISSQEVTITSFPNFDCLVPDPLVIFIIYTVLCFYYQAMRPLLELVEWALFALRVGRRMAKVSSFLQKTRWKGNNLFESTVVIEVSL